jgi:hypothetical protein
MMAIKNIDSGNGKKVAMAQNKTSKHEMVKKTMMASFVSKIIAQNLQPWIIK